MRGNPAAPGGPSISKPTWSNAARAFRHVGFFVFRGVDPSRLAPSTDEAFLAVRQEPWSEPLSGS